MTWRVFLVFLCVLGVPVVHLITYPFPNVWHKLSDNAKAIDWTFVSNFRKIMTVFLHEYFHLQ
jgi:glutaminyl-peptide cyclotransferase